MTLKTTDEMMLDVIHEEVDKIMALLGKRIGKFPMEEGLPMLFSAVGLVMARLIGGFAPDIEKANLMVDDHAEQVRKWVRSMMNEEIN